MEEVLLRIRPDDPTNMSVFSPALEVNHAPHAVREKEVTDETSHYLVGPGPLGQSVGDG